MLCQREGDTRKSCRNIMQDLKVALIQSSLHWENIDSNLKMFEQKISSIKDKVDVIILPEMFSTGFSMKSTEFSKANKNSYGWMEEISAQYNCVLTGSLIWEENDKYFNRLFWVQPDGTVKTYDKRHLFSMGKEHEHYSAGTDKLLVEWNGWKIRPQICYDLRFPVWNRNTEDYDLLFFVANWPERRSDAWKTLLKARAIENQAYVIGVNRVGEDGNGVYHSGDSSVYDLAGECLFHQANEEVTKIVELSKEKLTTIREKLPFLKDRDNFILSD